MTKKELAEMEALKTRLALRYYPEVERDVEPLGMPGVVNGWDFNLYSNEVRKACTSSVGHSYGHWDKTDSQHSRWLFSTRRLAYSALLAAMSKQAAEQLRGIELRMEMLNPEGD